MELASQCANEVTEHDWDSIIKLSKSKIDPRKKPLNLTWFRLTAQHWLFLVSNIKSLFLTLKSTQRYPNRNNKPEKLKQEPAMGKSAKRK